MGRIRAVDVGACGMVFCISLMPGAVPPDVLVRTELVRYLLYHRSVPCVVKGPVEDTNSRTAIYLFNRERAQSDIRHGNIGFCKLQTGSDEGMRKTQFRLALSAVEPYP